MQARPIADVGMDDYMNMVWNLLNRYRVGDGEARAVYSHTSVVIIGTKDLNP